MRHIMTFLTFIFCATIVFGQQAELITQQRIRGEITDFKFSPDGQYIANISKEDPSIHVWHLASEKIIGSLQDHEEGVNAFAFNADGSQIVSVHKDNKVIRWDLNTWSIIDSTTLEKTGDLVLLHNDKILISLGNKLSLFDAQFKHIKTHSISGSITCGKTAGNKAYIGSTSGQLSIIDWDNPEDILQKSFNRTYFQNIDIDLDKDLLLSVNTNGSVTEIMLSELSATGPIKILEGFSFGTQYGKPFAGKGLVAYISERNQVSIYNLEGNLVTHLVDTVAKEEIKVLEFNHDGSIMASSSYKRFNDKNIFNEHSIKVWDVQRKGLMSELKGSVNPVTSFSFHPEKNWVAIIGEGTTLGLWDMDFAEKIMDYELQEPKKEQKIDLITGEDAKAINPFSKGNFKDKLIEKTVRRTVNQVFRKEPTLVKFSSKGNYLITKLQKDEVRIYSVKDKSLKYEYFAMHQQERINDFITDPEEKYLICLGAGNEAVSIVDLTTGELIKKLETENEDASHEFLNNAISVAYHPKGDNFVVCTGRGQIFVWNKNFGTEFKTDGSNLHRAWGNAFVSYSKDGNVVYLNGHDAVRGYDINNFTVFGTTKLKMEGQPRALGTPQDYMVGFKDNTGYIEDLKTNKINTFSVQSSLINAVDASLRDYIGIALKNGEFRIIDAKTGKLLATFIGEDENTLIKTEDNFYKVDKEGFDLVSFRIGRNAYPFEQFDAYYNRPDLVLKSLKCPDAEYIDLYKQAHDRRLAKLHLTGTKNPDFAALPQLKILNKSALPYTQEESVIKLKINANASTHPLKTLKITINNVPIHIQSIAGKSYEGEVDLELIGGINKINVYAIDSKNQESLAESFSVNCLRSDQPNLYLITVGTSKYKDSRFSLNYAAKDAKDLNKLFNGAAENSIYGEVHTYMLTDEEVKKEAFDQLKAFLKGAGRNDQVIFYIAGHGLLDSEYAYYYGTYDINFLQPGNRGLAYANLEDILSGIDAVKKLLLMDTCHSGEVSEDEVMLADNSEEDLAFEDVTFRAVGPNLREGSDTKASAGKMARLLFADIRKGTGATVISSAGGVEFAMEGEDWKNGLFTYCLLNGLTNRTADLNNDGTIMLSELQHYLINKVGKLSHGKQVPTTRVQNIRLDYPVW